MKKNKFNGWMDVYRFTFRQSTKGIGFKAVTFIIAALIIGALILVNILSAKPKEEEKPSPIESVYVLDQSGLIATDYKSLMAQLNNQKFEAVVWNELTGTRDDAVKVLNDATKNEATAVTGVVITKTESGFELEGIIPEGSSLSKSDVQDLLEVMTQCFESNKMLQAGLTVDQLTTVLAPVSVNTMKAGEETNVAVVVIKMVAPAFFGLLLYMMLIFHGQTISKAVSSEKTSKLMETLLTSIHPYALITGKVLAVASMAMLQFFTWVVAAVAGLYGGNIIAHSIYPEYENTVVTIINFLKENIGESAFSLSSIILAVIIFCVGFLFYSVIAGLAGALVAKPEDVATTQAIFQFPVIISWLVCYIAAFSEAEGVLSIARFIPFTAPFCLPVDLLTGAVGIGVGVISTAILLISSVLIIMLAAKIYKGLVLYTGQKISMKMIKDIVRS